MSRPATKTDLIKAANAQFAKMWELVNSMSDAEKNAVFLFDDRENNLRDVLAHLYEWHQMVRNWHQIGTVEGGLPSVPGDGYTWKTLPELNAAIWKKYQGLSLADAEAMLKESHGMILGLIEMHTDEELFARTVYKWTKSSTLGAYFVSCTSSHYDWAMKEIKKYIKTYREINAA